MNIITELIRYFSIIIIGMILVNWYERKKGWEYQFKTSLLYILCWRTVVFFIVIIINLIFVIFLPNSLLNTFYFGFPPILLSLGIYIMNFILGVKIFQLFYHQKPQEFIVVILMIVIIEMILESFLFYIFLIPETLVSHYNF